VRLKTIPMDPADVARLRDLLQRWSELEPERCKSGGEDLAGTKRFYLYFPGHEFPIGYSSLDLLPVHKGALLFAIADAIDARGWGWTKDYAMRNDATVLWCGLLGENDTAHKAYRCTGHSTTECSTLLEVNLLDAYLQAFVGQGRNEPRGQRLQFDPTRRADW
jgi:hypothetical protein